MSIRFFNFRIEKNRDVGGDTVDFLEYEDLIKSAKLDFNKKFKNKKSIFISEIDNYIIRCTIKIDLSNKVKKIDTRHIKSFFNIVLQKTKLTNLKYIISFEFNPDDYVGSAKFAYDKLLELNREAYEFYKIGFPKPMDMEKVFKSLTGREDIKKEILDICNVIKIIHDRRNVKGIEEGIIDYNMMLLGSSGSGKDKVADIIYKMLINLGIYRQGEFLKVDYDDINGFRNMENNLKIKNRGIIYIKDNVEDSVIFGKHSYALLNLERIIERYSNNFLFIITINEKYYDEFMKRQKLKSAFKFNLRLRDINDKEVIDVAREFAKKEMYSLSINAEAAILEKVNIIRKNNTFQNVYTVKQILQDAILKKERDNVQLGEGYSNVISMDVGYITKEVLNNKNVITSDDLIFEGENTKNKKEIEVKDPYKELEDMIGLQEVKKKIEEIRDFLKVQNKRKELGLITEPICLHIQFKGNPGSGKTSVAKILGRIFKDLGIFETGCFVEASRDSLVGRYVGETSQKTLAKIEEAQGGILFIDEAYSLYNESEKDYGHECVATLIKYMEDKRDKFAVIFAGYSAEMDNLMNINPGLKDRISFTIEFPDYTPDEMNEIFLKFGKDFDYKVEDEAIIELQNIFRQIYLNREKNFSNGRLVRKIFERIKLINAARVMKLDTDDIEEIAKITLEDVLELKKDSEISSRLCSKREGIKSIGFIG
jgi:Holliday junction resolvasome RuvABC ATP-dependent DNA helicase subunit